MKTPRVKVSVIMPVYNAASSIDEAIRSVLTQRGVSFELLIGDDASTDETWAHIIPYHADPRVRAFRFHENRGAAATSNRLIVRSRGQYLFSCDADDALLQGGLRRLSNALDRNPASGVVYGNVLFVSRSGKKRVKRRLTAHKSWDLLGGFFANGGTLIRSSVMKKVGGYNSKLPYLEDCDLFLRLAECTKFFRLSGKPVYCQRRRAGSLSDQPIKKLREVSMHLLRNAIQRRYGYKINW